MEGLRRATISVVTNIRVSELIFECGTSRLRSRNEEEALLGL
jgi:hypothetical protein